MENNSNRVAYTKEHIEFILENYRNNPGLCVEKTGHSDSSIKMMLGNAVARLSCERYYLCLKFYDEVVILFLEANPIFINPMSI